MGYTNYWYTNNHLDPKTFEAFSKDVKDILKLIKVPLAYENDEPNQEPTVNSKEIRFNGVGEDGHETFWFTRDSESREGSEKDDVFHFCKTAQKPYDIAVTSVLTLAKYHFRNAVRVSSDGEAVDWQAAVELVNNTFHYDMTVTDNQEGIVLEVKEKPIANENDVKKVFGEAVT